MTETASNATTDTITVYMTAASYDEARRLAAGLIENRLAACVNILGQIQSVFYWDGVQEETEVALIAKASREDFPAVNRKIRELHSYDCPCVVAWPIAAGDDEFVQWIGDETLGKRNSNG
jgi:periplasmic divalent cation tolerance protein